MFRRVAYYVLLASFSLREYVNDIKVIKTALGVYSTESKIDGEVEAWAGREGVGELVLREARREEPIAPRSSPRPGTTGAFPSSSTNATWVRATSQRDSPARRSQSVREVSRAYHLGKRGVGARDESTRLASAVFPERAQATHTHARRLCSASRYLKRKHRMYMGTQRPTSVSRSPRRAAGSRTWRTPPWSSTRLSSVTMSRR